MDMRDLCEHLGDCYGHMVRLARMLGAMRRLGLDIGRGGKGWRNIEAMAQRVTLRKRQPYNTTSNRRRVVKTPGGKLVYHHLSKPATAPKCGDCGIGLPGIVALRPRQYARVSKTQKTVRRAYGGSSILRAFLVEEAKIVKKVIKSQAVAARK
ncbi:60S ribosomal protein L34A [Asterophora parasitica]|uniref:60S ribosomal protein L34A n=1 Tax=Asterophora parasitica TaxID=117018 RepID=A0A9P7KBI8_9AGAR|nr:60S ribosomal protein L34A [Asterophora parasitica]